MAGQDLDLGKEKKSKLRLIIVIGAVLVLVLVAAAFYFGKSIHFSDDIDAGAAIAELNAGGGAERTAFYQPLDPPFIINYEKNRGAKLFQVSLSVLTYNATVMTALQHHMPMIRNNLLMLFSRADPGVLRTSEGKEALRNQVRDEIQKIVVEQTGEAGIAEVFFTGFVMQ